MRTRLTAAATGGVLALGLVAGAPAGGDDADRSREALRNESAARHLGESAMYRCRTRNKLINQALKAPRAYRIRFAGRFPRSIRGGHAETIRDLRSKITMFRAFVRHMRNLYEVKKLRINPSRARLVLRATGKRRTPSAHLRASRYKRMNPKHDVTFRSNGKVRIHAPTRADRLRLLLPKRFRMRQRYRPPGLGFVKKAVWYCKIRKNVTPKDRRLGTIKVR